MNKIIAVVIAILIIFGGAYTIWGVFIDSDADDLAMKAIPVSTEFTEASAVDDPDSLEAEEEGSAVVICTQQVTVHTKSGTVDLFYQNPHESTASVMLELYSEGSLIATSETIPSGYELYKMKLSCKVVADEGIYDGKLRILFFDASTGERVNIDSEINILISIVHD